MRSSCSATSLLMASASCNCNSSSPLVWGRACSSSEETRGEVEDLLAIPQDTSDVLWGPGFDGSEHMGDLHNINVMADSSRLLTAMFKGKLVRAKASHYNSHVFLSESFFIGVGSSQTWVANIS